MKRPRYGSLAFHPRKKAKRIYPSFKTWPKLKEVMALGFAGYKAGMCRVVVSAKGEELCLASTVLDCPPLKVIGIVGYEQDPKGLKSIHVFAKELPKDLFRKVCEGNRPSELKEIEQNVSKLKELRLLVCTQPRLSGLRKKTPEIFELPLGGENIEEKLSYAKQLLGKELKVDQVFKKGELVDVIAITKGKGTQGPVKRFGIKDKGRKWTKKKRHTGALGPERPGRVRFTVPMAGQMGFQRRTEFNKRVLAIGNKLVPKAGFKRYGIIANDYVLIEGSVPGPKKRVIMLRKAIRPKKRFFIPEIKEIILERA